MNLGMVVLAWIGMGTLVCGAGENGESSKPTPSLVSTHPESLLTRTGLVLHPREVVTLPFTIGIDGSGGPFVIKSMRASCRCFDVPSLPERLEVGRFQSLPVTVVGFREPGSISGELRIDGVRDGREQSIVCSFAGEVHDYLVWPWSTALIDLGSRAIADPPGSWSFEVARASHPAPWDRMEVAIAGGDQFFSAQVKPIDGKRWTVTFTNKQSDFTGIVGARVRWSFWSGTDEFPYHPERSLRLVIAGPVSAKPAAVLVGGVFVGEVVERKIKVVGADKVPAPAIIAVHPSDPMRVVGQIVDGGQAVEVRFVASAPAGDANGHIDLALAGGGTVRVPYYLAIKDPSAAPGDR